MEIKVSDLQVLFTVIEEKNISITEVINLINGTSQSSSAEEIRLTVDYSQTVGQMIAAGKYGRKNSEITEDHFSLPVELSGQKLTVSAKLFHFNRSIGSEDAIAEMYKAGYRPATLAELLALGAKYSELQRQFPIIALDSVWHDALDRRCVSCLGVSGSGRELGLGLFDGGWSARCRFLGVRK